MGLLQQSAACIVTGDASLNEALCSGTPFWYAAEPHKGLVKRNLHERVAQLVQMPGQGSQAPCLAGSTGSIASSRADCHTADIRNDLTVSTLAAQLVLIWWGWVEWGVEGKLGKVHLALHSGTEGAPVANLTDMQQRALDWAGAHDDWTVVASAIDALGSALDSQKEYEALPNEGSRPQSTAFSSLKAGFEIVSRRIIRDCGHLGAAIESALGLLDPQPFLHGDAAGAGDSVGCAADANPKKEPLAAVAACS
jgi:hypothetical protein